MSTEFLINQYTEITRICPSCLQKYIVHVGGQKSGASPAVHVPHNGKAQGYCSSLCMAKALNVEDISETLSFKALKDMGIDPFTFLEPKQLDGSKPEQLSMMDYILRMKLQADGKVTDQELGYLYLPWITDEIDLHYQRYAAKIAANQLSMAQSDKPQKVIAVPAMGLPFATTLAEEMGVILNMSKKAKHAPNSWQYPIVAPNKPYVNGGVAHHAYHVEPGQKILLADDLLGEGDTIIPVIDCLREHGAIINSAAFYVIKQYRPGYKRLLEREVQPVAALNIRGFTDKGKFDICSSSNDNVSG